jgi:hypothetical protein
MALESVVEANGGNSKRLFDVDESNEITEWKMA